jgi:hypothetical protein
MPNHKCVIVAKFCILMKPDLFIGYDLVSSVYADT